jgi:hypothetical protein
MENPKYEDDINMDLDIRLEERHLITFLGFAFLAIWVLSIILLYNQN